jgi:ParB-like chromosome segregation protein Spo0J
MGDVRIERVAVEKIKPAPYNPRVSLQPGDPAYEKLKRSIAEFGSVDPLVWNTRTGNLVGGHQRLAVLLKEHLVTEVDVSVVDLPLDKEKALNLALNKVTGEWDDPALAALLLELQDGDIDATLSGFEELEIEALLDAAAGPVGEEPPGQCADLTPKTYGVLVTCDNETEQHRMYRRLKREGYPCKMLTL